MSQNSFADFPPRALGRFSEERENLSDVEKNGWDVEDWRAETSYVETAGTFPPQIFREYKSLQKVELRRRPCDGYSLQSASARRFEEQLPSFFPYPYQIDRRDGIGESLDLVLNIAKDELASLDYLHPLASVIQVIRPDLRIPFITRCWDFGGSPGALIKRASLRLQGSAEELLGTCICYEPPTQALLDKYPNNYHIFRTIVGHEIGHYWWSILSKEDTPWEFSEILAADGADRTALVEQVVSLFSIFIIMHRGAYTRREPFSTEELQEAYEKLNFESRGAARNEQRRSIIDRISRLGVLHLYPPLEEAVLRSERKEEDTESELSSDAIRVIRRAARELVERSEHLPFASTAAVIGQRKLDTFITYELAEWDEYPSWVASDRRARHEDKEGVVSHWREYRMRLPHNGKETPLGHQLQIARHLAHIRLHGGWAGTSGNFMQAADVERECSAEGRDLARVMALAIYAQHGKLSRRRQSLGLAKLLLDRDPAGLGYLVDYAKSLFEWVAQDPDCPEADKRFVAEVREVQGGNVHCSFWGEDKKRYRISFPEKELLSCGFPAEALDPGTTFKLFEVVRDGSPYLLPVFPSDAGLDVSSVGGEERRAAASEPAVA